MKKTGATITAIAFTFVLTASALAWGPGKGNCPNQGPNRGDGKGRYEWGVKLTDEQKEQMKALHDKFVDETANLRIDIHAKSEKIRVLMETSNPDAGELKSLVREVADLRGQLMANRVDFYLDAKKIAPDAGMGRWFHGGGMWGAGCGFHGKGSPKKSCGRY